MLLVNLTSGDCVVWQRFSRDPLYKEWAEGKCGAQVHTDPCQCTFNSQVGCAKGRITRLDLFKQGLGLSGSSGIPMALLDLTGLTWLSLSCNQLVGSIPTAIGQLTRLTRLQTWNNQLVGSIPSTIGELTGLTELSLSHNRLTSSIPQEVVGLKHVNHIALDGNSFTGLLPAFNFSQYPLCCAMGVNPFTCPLPDGADLCAGGSSCHSNPTPTCKSA
jgi:hypothetical protein